MNRLIVKFALAVAMALFVSFTAVTFIFHQSYITTMEEEAVPLANYLFNGVPEQIRAASDDERAAILQALAKELNTKANIEPLSSSRLTDAHREMIARGQVPITAEQGYSGATFFLPLDNDSVIAIGPLKPGFGPGFWDYVLILLVVFIVVAVTVTVMLVLFVRRLNCLEATAVRIGQGDLSARAEESSNDAVGSLARSFNEMAERNQQLLEAHRATLQAVSHELRTPAARIRFGLEMLSETKDPEKFSDRLKAIDEDLIELDHLVTELLELNRSEVVGTDERENLLIIDLFNQVLKKAEEYCLSLNIEVNTPPDLAVFVVPRLFRRALRNLLSNAVRYAKTQVTLTARENGDMVEVIVDDDGPGVPDDHRGTIFQPFARLDDSRSRKTGGVGLGLAIVARVVASHGGQVELTDAPSGGARFITRWPTAMSLGKIGR